ncbi:membrane protein insertion efficiency factor YidD [Spirosoma pollinicola]|uniref:Membrane protein insertion efficiency factor YidD n=1 Tax=Spirosoma pollinicola TaxID=2057025 RepID=A0A2K8ZCC8_9BACT|nr:membrane protein insertion efficiency factor YidD [Spirosoma pollinicola]
MPLPTAPWWLRASVRLFKWYRKRVSPHLGQRCVYEPTCSRYAELALRKHGFSKGLSSSFKRLHRCRPGAGGVDLP